MAKSKYLPIYIIIVVICFLSFTNNSLSDSDIKSNLSFQLKTEIETLDLSATAFRENKISIDSIQKAYFNCRKTYKKIEFQLCFLYPEFVNSKINGAPLLHIEKENSRPILSNPEGFQVIDEILFSDDLESNKNELSNLIRRLKNNYNLLYQKNIISPLKSEEKILAIRLQLIRIFTLGITGFDTPGSANAIEDAISSFEGIKTFLKDNPDVLPQNEHQICINQINETIAYLNKSTFENLNRFELVQNYLDPLYGYLLTYQKKTELKFITSWNPNSKSLFSSDFLNPYQFTNLKEEEDSSELKELGKLLFYDQNLSQNASMNCASCHNPEKAFTDGLAKSKSSKYGITVQRNAPTLLNSVYADRYFYDLRAFTLEQQVEHVLFNNLEYNTTYSELLKKINNNKTYIKKFKKIFKNKTITRAEFTKALASYVLSLQSNNSKFDKAIRGEIKDIEPAIIRGFNLFTGKANCATCHFTPTFSGLVPPLYTENESEILGVLIHPNLKELDTDEGRYENGILIEKSWIYEKSFKTVTVRNINETSPYFHNGAYTTLEEVIEFYNSGGAEGIGIATKNQTLGNDKLNLTEQEKKDLITFLKSLSDNPYFK